MFGHAVAPPAQSRRPTKSNPDPRKTGSGARRIVNSRIPGALISQLDFRVSSDRFHEGFDVLLARPQRNSPTPLRLTSVHHRVGVVRAVARGVRAKLDAVAENTVRPRDSLDVLGGRPP